MSLTKDGFTRLRLAEIKSQYDALFISALGPLNTNADSVIGQTLGIFSAALDDVWEALQDNYDSMYPATASGTALDGAVSYVGLSRLAASATAVTAAVYGVEGTVIPAGSVCRTSSASYSTTSEVVISRASALDVNIEVATLANSVSYQIVAGGISVTYTSDASATKAEIIAGLAALFATEDAFVATADGETLRLYSADGATPFALTVDAKLSITKRSSPAVFVAATTGANVVAVGALTAIESAIDGWNEVYNLVAGDTGRDVETDVELRARHATAISAVGSATLAAIRSRMLAEVDGVTGCQIYENRTNTTVDSLPPHSFETVVQGGSSQDIAEQLFATKPAGIETYGNVSVTVSDAQGDGQVTRFSRAVTKYGWVRVTVQALDTEETLPSTAATGIKNAVLAYANTNISIGDDVITQRFYGPIYSAVQGIGQLLVETAITDNETDIPAYGTANITIARAAQAKFDLTRITVNGL